MAEGGYVAQGYYHPVQQTAPMMQPLQPVMPHIEPVMQNIQPVMQQLQPVSQQTLWVPPAEKAQIYESPPEYMVSQNVGPQMPPPVLQTAPVNPMAPILPPGVEPEQAYT